MKWLGNIGLTLVATLLFWMLAKYLLIGSVALCILWALKKLKKEPLATYFYELACVIDELGNVIGGPVWNVIFFKWGRKPMLLFGSRKETMSMVFGVNFNGQSLKATDLNLLAVTICKIIDLLDRGHMARAAKNYKLHGTT